MTSKVKVKGKDKHPLYQWLTQKDYNKKDDYKINWNFNKFIVDPDGELVEHLFYRMHLSTNPLEYFSGPFPTRTTSYYHTHIYSFAFGPTLKIRSIILKFFVKFTPKT